MLSLLSPIPRLPAYSGPYHVGSVEYEIPINEIDAKSSAPEPNIPTIKFRLFYPTSATTSKTTTTTWVPPPQRQWTEAFTDFLGLSSRLSKVLNPLLSVLSYVTIPALANAPLLKPQAGTRFPLAIFSHGLAGNCNTYSSLCGSLASCGVVCAAIEHRDGSAPLSSVRKADGKVASSVGYKKYSHSPSTEVFDARNAQLRTRMWELDLLYTALTKLDRGVNMTNLASEPNTCLPTLERMLDLGPGRVSWIGHSFGAATISQFVKSVYHRHSVPSLNGTAEENNPGWRPLYNESSSNNLVSQIMSSSPVVLLDVWTMPLKAHSTQWLWERPMPCYDQTQSILVPSTIALISTEFYKWTDLKDRTRALLSSDPVRTWEQIQKHKRFPQSAPERPLSSPTVATPPNKASHSDTAEELALPPSTIPTESHLSPTSYGPADPTSDLSRTPSPFTAAQTPTSATSSSTSISTAPATHAQSPVTPYSSPAKLYHIPSTAHLSQSDFGVLFPTLTRYLMKAIDPIGTMKLNLRAITAVMKGAGLEVEGVVERKEQSGWLGWLAGGKHGVEDDGKQPDEILSGEAWTDGRRESRWEEVNLGDA